MKAVTSRQALGLLAVFACCFSPSVRAQRVLLVSAKNPSLAANLTDVADHVEHLREVAGIDHIGIGSDFEGYHGTVEGLEDVSCYPALFSELMRRGYAEEDLEKIAGLNLLRVFREVETVAAGLKRAVPSQ